MLTRLYRLVLAKVYFVWDIPWWGWAAAIVALVAVYLNQLRRTK